MSHKSRISSEKLRQKRALNASLENLEKREVLAPFVSTNNYAATFTAAAAPTEANLGTISITQTAKTESAAGFTSVTQLNSLKEFGGDIVRIQAGPGGDFGKGIYAISRGAGSNQTAVNRPGTIYRVDTATGKASVFFDMASMVQKLQSDSTANASNGVSNSSGLVNWYDITFDPEGYFFGRSAMLVSTVSNNDPTKNAVYAIGSDGSLIGALVQFSAQGSSQNFAVTPSSVLVPPAQYQSRIRGLFVGTGTQDTSTTPATYTALFFDSNTYRPGQNLNSSVLPPGVFDSNLNYGPQVGLTASNNLGNYGSQIFSAFTNFGVGSSGGLPGNAGFSGIDGVTNGLFISPNPSALQPAQIYGVNATVPSSTDVDQYSTAQTAFRRFQDIAFDQFGYFSYGSTVTPATGTTTIPTYVGSMFVTDMGNGLAVSGSVTVNSLAQNFYAPVSFNPSSGQSILAYNTATNSFVNQGSNFTGGRVMRVAPDGTMRSFAENFNVSSNWDSSSFVNSSFSITFAADGTKMWVSDNDGIWQFSSTLSLAGSTTGNQIGLNDLRSLGVPYEGQNSAVAVLDTGVDATNTSFRGRVARGVDINKRRGAGNIDTASGGHGTHVAGVVAQMVPEATIQPINLFVVGATAGGGTTGTTTSTLGVTSNQAIFKALQFLSRNPYVNDPIRPGQKDRIVASTLAWGTQTSFPTEGQAFQAFPQVVASFKQQLARIRKLGISTVAAAGQFGVPQGGTGTTGGTTTVTSGDFNGMAMPAVLNEVVSVGMTSPMPFYLTPNSDPTDPNVGPAPRSFLPIQFRTTTTGGGTTTGVGYGQVATMTNGQPFLYADDMLYSSNASITTDYVAPGVDVPTFSQTTGTNTDPLRFDIAGTSMSAGVTAGSFALVTSAVNYWTNLARAGATSDAYLAQPVGSTTLNFGKNALKDLSLYASPDGVNSILQWTAVPVNYNLFNDIGGGTNNTTTGNVVQPQTNLSYSRIDVGNAIASIEGQVAMQYMIQQGTFPVIDSNKNGMMTAGELQNFVNNAQAMGMPEAGAMARLLGGTATYDAGATEFVQRSNLSSPSVLTVTQLEDVPDPAGVLARRFNYFDFAADGQINGFLTLDQIKALSQSLLPRPDSFSIIDRTRSSANTYLLDPEALRNYNEITKLNYSWVYATAANLKKYRNFSPAQWGVNKGQNDRSNPVYALYDGPPTITTRSSGRSGSAVTGGSGSGTGSAGVAAGTGGSTGTSTGTGTGAGTGTGTGAASGSNNGGNQAALMAAIQALASGGKVTPTGTTSGPVTSNTGTGSLQGASNLNRKVVAPSSATPQLNILNQPVRTVKTRSTLQSIADKVGLGKLI